MTTTKMPHYFKIAIAFALGLTAPSFAGNQLQKEISRNTQEDSSSISKRFHPKKDFETVELFEAMEDEDFQVVVEVTDAANAVMRIENGTNKSLAVHMPLAFSLVPATTDDGADVGFVGGFGRDIGGGCFGGRHENDGSGGGILCKQAYLNIPPECSGELQLQIFYPGNRAPDSKSIENFKLAPINTLTTDRKIFDMCRWLANGGITQEDVQARALARAKTLNGNTKKN